MNGEPGQVLALQGDPGSGMFVILDGTVSVELRGGFNGARHRELLRRARPSRTGFGAGCASRAATKVECLSIPRADVIALVESEPSLALAMLRELARRLSNA